VLLAAGRTADADKLVHEIIARTPNPSSTLLLEESLVYMRSGRATEALGVLEKILASDPTNADALIRRSAIYVSSGRNLDQAIHDLQSLRDRAPDAVNVRMELMEAYHLKADDDNAIHELEAVLRIQPDDKEAVLRLAQFYGTATPPRWLDMEQTLQAARTQPQLINDVDVILAQASMWMRRHDMSKAGDLVAQARKIAPNSQGAFQMYCDLLLQTRQYRQLLDVTNPMVQNKQAPWWVYQFRGKADKALDDKQAALEELSAGLDAATAANDDGAISQIVQTIASEVGVQQASVRVIGRAQKGEHSWMKIMAYLDQVQGDLPGAVGWLEKIMDDPNTTPQELDAVRRAASVLYMSQNPPNAAKAIDIYKKEVDRNPNDVAALNNLACAMILPNSGYTAKDALEYSTKAYTLTQNIGKNDAMIDDTQGYILVMLGRVDEGISLLQQALDKQAFPEGLYHLGIAYLDSSTPQPLEAQKVLQQATDMINLQAKQNIPVDMDLKSRIENAMARARQASPTTQKSPA
jgi:tetratricopeptide (TPR) repeat protein